MHGTLIGVFITSLGIVIGTDTRIWGPGVAPGSTVDKTCQPSPRTVAALQGWYGFPPIRGVEAQLLRRFRVTCAELGKQSTSKSVSALADLLMNGLQEEMTPYLMVVPPSFKPPLAPDPHLVYLTVAGFEASAPVVTVRELRFVSVGTRWGVFQREASGLGLTTCGARFHGEDVVAVYLMRGDKRIPTKERDRQEVKAARSPGFNCSLFSPDNAKALFRTAVRLTQELGPSLGIPEGRVGGDLYLHTIDAKGKVTREVFPEGSKGTRR